jgi:phenylacetate-CoA ligase
MLHRQMARAPYLSSDETQHRAFEKLNEILVFASETVPYYKTAFDRYGIDPARIRTPDDWNAIPIMDKDVVRNCNESLVSNRAGDLGAVWSQSSGSTGTTVRFLLDRHVNAAVFALFWRAWDTVPGWRIGKRQATITGYVDGKWEYMRKTRILALSSFQLSDDSVEEYYRLLKDYRPVFLRGYPSSLYLLAKLLEKRSLELKFPVVISQSETLQQFQRDAIEQYFGCRLIDHYTHWECLASLRECLHGKLHAENDFGWHEIVRDDGRPAAPGEVGRLVSTSLFNKAMPLIRYDTRDLAVWSDETSCACGSRFPIVRKLIGRLDDVLITPEGTFPSQLDAPFKYCTGIYRAQVIQTERKSVNIHLVTDHNYNAEQESVLVEELRKRLGDRIEIRIRYVDESEIEKSPVGKVRFVISRIPANEKLGHA